MEYRQLVNILALFFIVQLMGLLVAFYFLIPSQVSIKIATSTNATTWEQAFIFLSYVIVGTIILLLVFRLYHGALIFNIIEAIVVVSASFYLFLIILGGLFPQDSNVGFVVLASLLIPILLVIAKNKWPRLRNQVAIVASIGAGVVLGMVFSFTAAYIFMAIIAAYDYIAVFVTKHMLALGKEAVERNLSLLVGSSEIEVVPKSYLKKSELAAMRKRFRLRDIKNVKIRDLVKRGGVPFPTQAALGTGDLAIPLMLAVSAFMTYFSYFNSLVIVAGASAGLVFTMMMLKSYKIALPAIPPLFSFINIALGIEYLPTNVYLSLGMFLMGVLILAIMVTTARRATKRKDSRIFK